MTANQNGKGIVPVAGKVTVKQAVLAEWKDVLAQQHGPFDPVQKLGELAIDPQVTANGYVAEIEDEAGCTLSLMAPPIGAGRGRQAVAGSPAS